LLYGKKNTVDAKAWFNKHYSAYAPVKSTVELWLKEVVSEKSTN
jgi:hypothetical protein